MAISPEISELQADIEDLQSRLVHQDDILEELSKVVARQADSIDILKQQISLVIEKLQQQKSESGSLDLASGSPDPAKEKPPHY